MRMGHFVSFGMGGASKVIENLVRGLATCSPHELVLFYNDQSILNDNMMKCKHYSDLFITSHDQVVQSIKAIVGCDDED